MRLNLSRLLCSLSVRRWLPWVWPTLQAFRQSDSFICCWGCSLCCILPWQKLRALSCFLGWPIYTPSEEASVFFFLLIQARPLLLLFSVPETPPLSTFVHPGLPRQPPTHLQISFTWRRVHHYWPEASPNGAEDAAQRRAWVWWCIAPLPPPSPACSCRWISVKEPLSAFLEWMLGLAISAFRVGGCYSYFYMLYISVPGDDRKIIPTWVYIAFVMLNNMLCWKIAGLDTKERIQFTFKEGSFPTCVRIKCPFLYWPG